LGVAVISVIAVGVQCCKNKKRKRNNYKDSDLNSSNLEVEK
jgi:hypothetical protein